MKFVVFVALACVALSTADLNKAPIKNDSDCLSDVLAVVNSGKELVMAVERLIKGDIAAVT